MQIKNNDLGKAQKIQDVAKDSSNNVFYFMGAILIIIWVTNKLGWNYEEKLMILFLLGFLYNNFSIIIRLLMIK